MAYPPAPWHLQGQAAIHLQLVDIEDTRPFVPPEFSVVPVLPGKTVATLYLARYGAGSELEYSELIIMPALVWLRGRLGAWISHIYVDDADSVAGGREIWALPKELAEFTWAEDGRVAVHQEDELLCTLRPGRPRRHVPLPILLPSFSHQKEKSWFYGKGTTRLGVTRGSAEVPSGSPFSALNFGRGLCVHLRSLNLQVIAPSQRATD